MKQMNQVKKSILLLCMLLSASILVNAQTITIQDDFEGNGTITSWGGDDCNINTQLTNPQQLGMNTSATVLEYHDIGGLYANIRFETYNNFDFSTGHTFSFKIYVPSSGLTGNQTNQVSLKLQNGTLGAPWSTQSEIIKTINLDQWQTVTFDFLNDTYINLDGNSPAPTQRSDFNRVLIQINGENNTDEVLAYIDDFTYDGTIPEPPVFGNLIWSDEFNTDGAIDGTNWFHQTLLPAGGSWFNGEVQHYTDRIDNAVVDNGVLKIIAKKENYTNQGHTKQYTSARLNSKFAFKYGRVEVRAKLPTGAGTWPAIWMLGKNINEAGAYWQTQGFGNTSWPACGEIDIMEHWGNNQNYVQSALHTPSSFGATVNHGGQTVSTASTDFHIYALEWTADKMVFSVDGLVHYTYNPPIKNASTWPFDAEQYLLLNVAIQPNIDPNFVESAMEIDYVRVYEQTSTQTQRTISTKMPIFYPNPVDDTLYIELDETINENIMVSIHSIDGRLVKTFQENISGNQLIINDLSGLAQGYYYVSFNTEKNKYSFKVFKH